MDELKKEEVSFVVYICYDDDDYEWYAETSTLKEAQRYALQAVLDAGVGVVGTVITRRSEMFVESYSV